MAYDGKKTEHVGTKKGEGASRQIDKLMYQPYGVIGEEIKIVEGAP